MHFYRRSDYSFSQSSGLLIKWMHSGGEVKQELTERTEVSIPLLSLFPLLTPVQFRSLLFNPEPIRDPARHWRRQERPAHAHLRATIAFPAANRSGAAAAFWIYFASQCRAFGRTATPACPA